MSPLNPILGIDLDNTIVDYDDIFREIGLALTLKIVDTMPAKGQVRDLVRALPDGELRWQTIQAQVYGSKMHLAVPSTGVLEFLKRCKREDWSVYIVSHKTRFASQGDESVDLRSAALCWLENNKFFLERQTGIDSKTVFFEQTRFYKVERIRSLGCNWFVDDLIDTFLAPNFPASTKKVLYGSVNPDYETDDILFMSDWESIFNRLLQEFSCD